MSSPVSGPSARKLAVAAAPLLLLVLVLLSTAVRLWPIGRVHYWDETVYLQNAEVICCGKTNYTELDSRPPLLSILYAGAFLAWHSPYAASILTAVLNGLGVLFLYLGGRILLGRTTAGIAAVLFAFAPFFVSGSTGNSLLTDSPAITLMLVSFWLLLRGIRDDSTSAFVFGGIFAALAVLMRFASAPVVALLLTLAFGARRWIPAVLGSASGFLGGVIPYFMWSRFRWGGFFHTLRIGWLNVQGSVEPPLFYVRHFSEIFGWITVAGLVLWLVAWMTAGRISWQRDEPELTLGIGRHRGRAGTYLFLFAWAAIVLAYYSTIAHKELRYVLPLAVPILLLAARGLSLLVRIPNHAGRAIGSVLLIAAMGYSFAPDMERFRGPLLSSYVSEEKQVADFLDAAAKPGMGLYVNFNFPVFGYYTHLKIHRLADYEDSSIFYREFPDNMVFDGYVLVYRNLEKDPRIDWLDSNPHFKRFGEFPSIVVYEYHAKEI